MTLRIALPVKECPYEASFPVGNARRDPRRECDESTTICELSELPCCLDEGHHCPEFPDLKPRQIIKGKVVV